MKPPIGETVNINFGPGVAIFQVWVMPTIIGGEAKVFGPYPDLGSASVVAARYPGSLLVAATCLFMTPHAPAAANKPALTPVPK